MTSTRRALATLCALALLAVLPAAHPLAAEGGSWKPLELADVMKLRSIESPVLSDDGAWVAYELRPDRGDGAVEVVSSDGATRHSIERGTEPEISSDSRWVAALVKPTLEESEKAKENGDKDGPKTSLALLSTADGEVVTLERVESFAFSEDGRWLAYHRHEEEDAEGEDEEGESAEEAEGESPEAPETEAAEEPEAGAGQVEGVPEPAVPESEAEATEPGEAEVGSEEPPSGSGEEEEPVEEEETEPGAEGEEDEEEKDDDERLGRTLVLRELATGDEIEIPHVTEMAFDERSGWLAYAVAAPGGEGNGVFVRELGAEGAPETALRTDPRGRHGHLTWTDRRHGHLTWTERREDGPAATSRLGFVAAPAEGDPEDGAEEVEAPGETDPGDLVVWSAGDAEARVALASAEAPEGWYVPAANELAWSDDGERLFFGLKPDDERIEEDEEEEEEAEVSENEGTGGQGEAEEEAETEEESPPFDPYDFEAILEDRGVDVWHWDDPLLQSQQKKQWDEEKTRTYRAVYHLDGGRVVPLADREMRQVEPVDNPRAALGAADVPYLQRITWDGWYFDLYHVSLEDGEKTLVAEELRAADNAISPDGRWVVYYRTPHWYLFDADDGSTRNLTGGIGTGFDDEDHDYPEPAPGYGIADWVARPPSGESGGAPTAEAVLIYDKFDLWRFPLAAGAGTPVNLSSGREGRTMHRVVDLDPEGEERAWVEPDERLLVQAYSDAEKHRGVVEIHVDEAGTRTLEPGLGTTYRLLARAADADTLLFTRESYSEFPDLWVSDLELEGRRELSDANPRMADFGWGTAELVHWRGDDGEPLDGVLIKPAGYVEGERYPVIVYFYRLLSPVLHRFLQPSVAIQPALPVYASHGYAIFLPDIRFEIGRPGHAATRALTSGVRHLVNLGVADPDAIGLHGHSWSGYQTAFVVTQTDGFAAAVAGAPVSNMTSAYGGIRYGTGLARMFQYEQSQSRLGVSLWQGRDRYIENSPLFYADRIDTPLLMMFGDEDGAVPWTQGIELYLAMRRLRKPGWLLQYRGEGHSLQKYPNKLDYALKMKEFFDHYLQGAPAPEWLTDGVPYRGE